jgi:uncharacterized protein
MRRTRMRAMNMITLGLLIVGGLNWGLVGLFDFDLVSAIFGNGAAETATSSMISRIVYVVVALCAIWQVGTLMRISATNREAAYR